ncbi:VWA domain-containing protein [Endozoicomonas sp.]|uniref:VWA domain-containing protein n=1 Tax=Endozoicomonas sp. TaxID=1892382 RepID=UPI003AF56D80
MNRLFKSGEMQKVIERILALAFNFDGDGEIDIILFGTNAYQLPPVSINNLDGYVKDVVLKKYKIIEATKYATALNLIHEKYQNNKADPVFVIFITDGNNSDKTETTELVRKLSKEAFFLQFVGIGVENFPYLRKLDELKGRLVDNAGFMHINYITNIPDEELYSQLLNEFPEWIISAKSLDLL